MAAISSKQLLNANLAAGQVGGAETLPSLSVDFCALLIVENNTGTTIGGKIEHSHDGLIWIDLQAFTGGVGDYLEKIDLTEIPLGHVRANMTAAGGSGADVKVELRYDNRK